MPKSPARGTKGTSATRTPLKRSIAAEGLAEVEEVNGATASAGRMFTNIASAAERPDESGDGRAVWKVDEGVEAMKSFAGGKGGVWEGHLSSEEEIEKRRGLLMTRLRMLRAECERLEQQVDVARQSRQSALATQEFTAVDTTMYSVRVAVLTYRQSLLRSNDMSFSAIKSGQETVAKPLPSAAPKKLKNPLPLLRFIHPLTFYSTNSNLIPIDDVLIRQYRLNGYALDRELYFEILMSVNEKQERITNLRIKTSPFAQPELSSFLERFPPPKDQGNRSVSNTYNAQIALTALSTYAKLSSQRSTIFSRLSIDLSHLLPPTLRSTLKPVSRKGKEREVDTTLPPHRTKCLWAGERTISFRQGPLWITISWDIIINTEGFAASKVTIASKVPLNCTSRSDVVKVNCRAGGR